MKPKRMTDLMARNALASGSIVPPETEPLPVHDYIPHKPRMWVDLVWLIVVFVGLAALYGSLALGGIP